LRDNCLQNVSNVGRNKGVFFVSDFVIPLEATTIEHGWLEKIKVKVKMIMQDFPN